MTIAEKLTTIAENEQRVYNAGYNAGKALNYDEGYDAGKQAEYEEQWNIIQGTNGSRTNYAYGFAGKGWTSANFKPLYNITPINISNMFTGTGIVDLKAALENAGVTMDLSSATTGSYFMQDYPAIKRLPVINISNISDLSYFIYNCSALEYIEEFIFNSNGTQTVGSQTLNRCGKLVYVKFSGVIGKSGLNTRYNTSFSRETWESLIRVFDPSLTLTMTGSKASVEAAFGANYADAGSDWNTLLAERPNLTVALQ